MMGYYFNNMMGYGGSLTLILVWIVLILGIVALWKYITKK